MPAHSLTQRNVWEAKKRIGSSAAETPLIYSPVLSDMTGSRIYLKLENINESGSFKIRGAFNKIRCLTQEEQQRGVTTFSTGNFGVSVATVANQLGIKAVICLSKRVPKAKVDVLKRTGAHIEVIGESQDDAEEHCYHLEREQGLTVVHPFDDPFIIAGQGTIGLEILDELPEVDTVIGGLSGGGLHSGLAKALKPADSRIRLIGVSTAKGPAMYESIQAGKPVMVKERDTLADSLLGGIGLNNQYTFSMVQQYVDDMVLLEEKDIAKGMAFMLETHRMAVEGAAAAGIGAILHKHIQPGSHTVVVISGSSVDTSTICAVAQNDQSLGWNGS
ncbi:hydroxyectoine utilization dehydratase EutB [Lentibacillus halophilus]|uniref:Hydroxyectoine utilization dehydratase EutB n=1 Tax=Lentibacillus halophilus TaxID=295065 RepID=A0ABN0ZHF7_9BACI